MTLEKIISIDNVGRFTSYRAAGDVAFRDLNLIYGDNGSGKTTLTAILGSLAADDAAPIMERATLGASGDPGVQVRSSTDTHSFDGTAWSQALQTIDVFDDSFVRENVYAGDVVGTEQRRNLYQVIVGPAAVKMARDIDRLDSEGRALASSISQTEASVRARMQSPFDLEAFLKLSPIDDADSSIAKITRELSAARNAREVMNRPELSRYRVPNSPRTLVQVLGIEVAGISETTEARVRAHIQAHLGDRGEAWLRHGLSYVDDDQVCPFCAQGLEGVDLVQDFASYFSDVYREHIVELQQALNEVERRFSAEVLAAVDAVAVENRGRIALWEDLLDAESLTADVDEFRASARAVREAVTARLRSKLQNPSEAVAVSEELEAALRDFENASRRMSEANDRIDEANVQIAQFKRDAAGADQHELESELRRLRNSQIRHDPEVAQEVHDLLELRRQKHEQDETKGSLREQLRTEAEALLASYEQDINVYLSRFGANFRIAETGPSFAGGRASSTYRLAVNDVEVDLGNADTPRGTPCFRTALSSGDKNTLALAFFLARLDRSPNLSEITVVFDDPLTSLDAFRTSFTQQYLVQLVARAAQVIVLSHDPFFLKGVADYWSGSPQTLRLAASAGTYKIVEWDIDEFCLAQAHRDFFVMRKFLEDGTPDGGEMVTVARAIRPYLEGYLRNRFPGRFLRGQTFGTLITAIRSAPPDDPLAALQPRVAQLDGLNAYTRDFHHSDPGGAPAIINEGELRTRVQEAINFVQRG